MDQDKGPKLTEDEDAELRRLHWFEGLGCHLSDALATLKSNIRSRDRRMFIREPLSAVTPLNAGDLPTPSEPAHEPRAQVEESGYWVRVRH
jgi:hypothetical protein